MSTNEKLAEQVRAILEEFSIEDRFACDGEEAMHEKILSLPEIARAAEVEAERETLSIKLVAAFDDRDEARERIAALERTNENNLEGWRQNVAGLNRKIAALEAENARLKAEHKSERQAFTRQGNELADLRDRLAELVKAGEAVTRHHAHCSTMTDGSPTSLCDCGDATHRAALARAQEVLGDR